ncbi:DUF455 domain protein [Clohesyomyces aquaticus]|uniref:DUF455 domain protein n=1 Tax=Clohesyomyces aquaticus TaxID=1231657 RepID=A0A1Y1YQC1_9PLEO|nr:DUF455 domain protein [Clohesyomyces aquaticus]
MQGFNMGRYYPPDSSNPPTFNTSHPLGSRARKSNQGILTVRFELPFAVWCTHCSPPLLVGQGVRFNAEKKKVGNYHSTPIWSFRMKHSACGGAWEIRTDPEKAEYVVVEGGRKRDYGPEDKDVVKDGELKGLTEEERERRRNDAFASLEGRLEDKEVQKKNRDRVEELLERSEGWRDPYTANQKLRAGFRVKRKVLEKEERYKEGLQDKFSIGLEIADEIETDGVRARLVEFGASAGGSGDKDSMAKAVEVAGRKPLFEPSANHDAKLGLKDQALKGRLKSEQRKEKTRLELQQSLISNTKAVVDPFLNGKSKTKGEIIPGLKRKREVEAEVEVGGGGEAGGKMNNEKTVTALVGYDSD